MFCFSCFVIFCNLTITGTLFKIICEWWNVFHCYCATRLIHNKLRLLPSHEFWWNCSDWGCSDYVYEFSTRHRKWPLHTKKHTQCYSIYLCKTILLSKPLYLQMLHKNKLKYIMYNIMPITNNYMNRTEVMDIFISD